MQLVENPYHFKLANKEDVQIFHESFVSYTNSFLRQDEFAVIFESKLKDKNKFFFLLQTELNKKTVGCVALNLSSELFEMDLNAEIVHFYILPKYRKLQAADILYNFIENKCKEFKVNKITVACGINSTLNQHFYTKRKFNYVKKGFLKYIDR
jgi:N-acetylglutamate synthase-like GNAT family acetyltransferase